MTSVAGMSSGCSPSVIRCRRSSIRCLLTPLKDTTRASAMKPSLPVAPTLHPLAGPYSPAMDRVVDQARARRIAVHAQLLDGSATGVLDTVRRLGFLQIDPIATVATPQLLVLWSRLGQFDRDELDRLIWEERKLVEVDAFIYPVEDLPLLL